VSPSIQKLPPLFMRREPACSKVPFERFSPPVREGSGQWELDRNPKFQATMAELHSLLGNRPPRRYPKGVSPKDGDIVGYLDEKCTQPLFRYHWWQLSPSERRKLSRLSFMWVSLYDPTEPRRRLVWL
jgi:hypothetical protein